MDIQAAAPYGSRNFQEPTQKRRRLDHHSFPSAGLRFQASAIARLDSKDQAFKEREQLLSERVWDPGPHNSQKEPATWSSPTSETTSYSKGHSDLTGPLYHPSDLPREKNPLLSGTRQTCHSLVVEGNPGVHIAEGSACLSVTRDKSLLCFGMISDVPLTTTHSSILTTDTSNIALLFVEPNLLVQPGQPGHFGKLDDRMSKILVNLGSGEEIKFQIYCRNIKCRAAQSKKVARKVGANELQYLLNAIIYGPQQLCDAVGLYLTKCGVYLQDPLHCDGDYKYSNPHIISRSEGTAMTSSLMNLKAKSDVEVIRTKDLFAELSEDDHLLLTEAPDAINTPLYIHQKRALTFMTRREEGWQYNDSMEDFWVKEVDETGQMTYTNMITEISQNAPPPACPGGLLADQMGLGKSLTVISLIASNTCKTREPITFTSEGYLKRLKSTMVVVPYSLLEVWNTQLKRHLKPNTLTWMKFHGNTKKRTLDLARHDIVITTFETLVSEQSRHLNPEYQNDTLFSFSWHRIVLDEAHIIRNRTTSMARAACAIHATNRWAITGTPIQNCVTDFASLLQFLQLYPFSIPRVFDEHIARPWLKSGGDRDISSMKKLVNCISLSRTKSIIDLPKREDLIHHLDFSAEEHEFYNTVKEGVLRKLNEAVGSTPVRPGQYLNALQWLNELRLLCNHGLAHAKINVNKPLSITPQDIQNWNKSTANRAFETIVCHDEAICSMCGNSITDGGGGGSSSEFPKPILSKCLILTCGSCVKHSIGGELAHRCPHDSFCKSIEVSWASENEGQARIERVLPSIQPERVSTKLKTLLKSLQTCYLGEKSVVFSYWTTTLDIIESLLRQSDISYTRIDGKHSGERREEAIEKFQTDEKVQVILVSITCGGAGLDLTAASVAYLLEPQWNPMLEEQALCRIHRLGQAKEVKTIRYRIRGSFEEKVAAIQDLKRQIAADAFSIDGRKSPLDSTNHLEQLRAQLI